MLTPEQIEEKAQYAKRLKEHGFNCSQAVVAACADLYDIDNDTALRISASFGGGIAQMRMVCGAATGMFMLAGLENGNTISDAPQRKMPNYHFVQSLAKDFSAQHGSLICADLLGLNAEAKKAKMPCPELVAQAVRQYLNSINNIHLTQ